MDRPFDWIRLERRKWRPGYREDGNRIGRDGGTVGGRGYVVLGFEAQVVK